MKFLENYMMCMYVCTSPCPVILHTTEKVSRSYTGKRLRGHRIGAVALSLTLTLTLTPSPHYQRRNLTGAHTKLSVFQMF